GGGGGNHFVAPGGGGCSAGGDASLGLALLAIPLVLRRRRRRAIAIAFAAAGALAASGCKPSRYCIDCETGDRGGTRTGPGIIAAGPAGDAPDGKPACDPNQIHKETCNHADDDCDGKIDEGFDLTKDINNCGSCGNACNKPGAQTTCDNGGCKITGCFPG